MVSKPDGSRYNRESIAFFRKLNSFIFGEFPDVLMIAEESTDFPGVTHPISESEMSLGFSLKWNMGFANDFYRYLGTDPLFRKHCHTALNFPIMYAFRENYVLPISHDEVVHGKKSFIGKISGGYDSQFLQMRAALLLIMTYPGKKMMFMGTEYAPFREWDYENELEWFMTAYPPHHAMREYVAALNRFYLASPALWERDFSLEGFEWLLADDAERNLVAYVRRGEKAALTVAVSFSGAENRDVLLPAEKGTYERVFATSAAEKEILRTESIGGKDVLRITLPPFGGVVLRKKSKKLCRE